jgi:hypothetical protein
MEVGKMKKKIAILMLEIFLLSCAELTQAAPITIQITGNVTSASGSALPSTIYQGVTFTGTYTYDSSVAPTIDYLEYYHYVQNAPYGIDLLMSGYEFNTVPGHVGQFDVRVMNDSPSLNLWDYYEVESYQTISDPSIGFAVDLRWVLGDIKHTALDSTALPVTAPVLATWGYNTLRISGSDTSGHTVSIYGTVTQAVLIPEPLTGLLMMTGMLLLRRKR